MGEVFATRELELQHSGGQKTAVTVGIYQPREVEGEWQCDYETRGLGKPRRRFAAGIDAMQALMLALRAVASDLATCDEGIAGRLRWLDQSDLGFASSLEKDAEVCSFCGKDKAAVQRMIAGGGSQPARTLPVVRICDECIALCHSIVQGG
jgi:hypothetical protein